MKLLEKVSLSLLGSSDLSKDRSLQIQAKSLPSLNVSGLIFVLFSILKVPCSTPIQPFPAPGPNRGSLGHGPGPSSEMETKKVWVFSQHTEVFTPWWECAMTFWQCLWHGPISELADIWRLGRSNLPQHNLSAPLYRAGAPMQIWVCRLPATQNPVLVFLSVLFLERIVLIALSEITLFLILLCIFVVVIVYTMLSTLRPLCILKCAIQIKCIIIIKCCTTQQKK